MTPEARKDLVETKLIINGKAVKGNRKIEVRNPASPDKVVGMWRR